MIMVLSASPQGFWAGLGLGANPASAPSGDRSSVADFFGRRATKVVDIPVERVDRAPKPAAVPALEQSSRSRTEANFPKFNQPNVYSAPRRPGQAPALAAAYQPPGGLVDVFA